MTKGCLRTSELTKPVFTSHPEVPDSNVHFPLSSTVLGAGHDRGQPVALTLAPQHVELPLQHVAQRVDISGRSTRWSIELDLHCIVSNYGRHRHLKVKV